MKKLFLTVSAIFAAIPGLIIITSGLGTPPDQKILFGGVIEFLGALSLLILWINRNMLRRISKAKITRLSIIMGVLCFLFLTIYIVLFSFCVIKHHRGTAYYPLWTSGKIARMVERHGSRSAAIEEYGIYAVLKAIDEMPNYAIPVTTIILLFFYQAVFTTLTIAFGLLGIYLREPLNSS